MSINLKILKKLDSKTKNKPLLKEIATDLLILESEGIGQYKDEYKNLIEKKSEEDQSED